MQHLLSKSHSKVDFQKINSKFSMNTILPSLWLLFSFISLAVGAQTVTVITQASLLPQPESGRIERLAQFPSKHVDPRHIDVWLPNNFAQLKATGQKFNVIYMHDGQMLFDPQTTWNKQAWHADRAVSQLMASGQIAPTLLVGIWNNEKFRHSEYFPQKFLPHLAPQIREKLIADALQNKPQSDAYLRFITTELKPYIDARYPTLTGPANTAIMGSSMGGLISVYALNEYPQIFGSAAGLSTHWMGIGVPNSHIPIAAFTYLRDHLPQARGHKIYQDHGTLELDANYASYQALVNQIIRDKGYVENTKHATFLTQVYEGTGHNEKVWAERLTTPLLFLFGGSLSP
jgi:enterochelin esterase-like enzyme